MFLVIDTETTGFPLDNLSRSEKCQARIVSLSAALVNKHGIIVNELHCLLKNTQYGVKLDGTGAQKINKLDDATCDQFGLKREVVECLISEFLGLARCIVAYNISFDWRMLQIEFPTPVSTQERPRFCLMNNTVDLVDEQLLPQFRRARYKLGATYEALFKQPLKDAHGSKADCYAAISVLKYVIQNRSTRVAEYLC